MPFSDHDKSLRIEPELANAINSIIAAPLAQNCVAEPCPAFQHRLSACDDSTCEVLIIA